MLRVADCKAWLIPRRFRGACSPQPVTPLNMAWIDMDPMTLAQVSEACGGRLLRGDPARRVHRVCTDTRAILPQDLFIALRGLRFDGHSFLEAAVRAGAEAAVVEAACEEGAPPGIALIGVQDTRASLGQLAGHCRRGLNATCVAVAGSNGKTSTKELLASVLAQQGRTHASAASFNNDVGVPLTLLGADASHRYVVAEAGSNHPGELAPLLQWIQPQHGILTSIGREHLEFFGSLEGVIEEESQLAAALPEEGLLVMPGGVPGEALIRKRSRARVVTAGLEEGCDWAGKVVRQDWGGTEFVVAAPRARYSGTYQIPLLGKQQAGNAIRVVALAAQLGLEPEAIRRGLAASAGAPMRMEPRMRGGLRILNDAYNANPDSMAAALDVFRELPVEGKRVAVLGDMAELGVHSDGLHAEAGRKSAESRLDWLVGVGEGGKELALAARQAGGIGRVDWVNGTEAAAGLLNASLVAGDAVLLKGSRRMRLEKLAEVLTTGEVAVGKEASIRG